MLAPRLRHRITIQRRIQTQDTATGAVNVTWADWLYAEPAEVVPLSGREFIQSAAMQAQVSARITIRWHDGLHPSMRILFDGFVYEISAILPDPTARRWLTVMAWKLEPYEVEEPEPEPEPEPVAAVTWDPAAKSAGIVLSGGNLTASTSLLPPVQTVKSTTAYASGKRAFRVQFNYTGGSGSEQANAGLVDDAFDPTSQDFASPDVAHTMTVMCSGDIYDHWETIYLNSLSGSVASGEWVYFWVDANKVWCGLDPDAPLGDPEAGTDPVMTFTPGTTLAIFAFVYANDTPDPSVTLDPTWTHGTFAAWES